MGLLKFLFGKKNKAKTQAEVSPEVEEIAPAAEETAPAAEEATPAVETAPAAPTDEETEEEIEATFSESVAEIDGDTDVAPEETATEAAPAEGAQSATTARRGRFEIKRSRDGRYVFNLYASNHVIVATSQVYSSASSAMGGIKSIIANAERSGIEDTTLKAYDPNNTIGFPKWEIYLDKGGKYRFRLYATNGSCIVHSQGYTSKTNCKRGIESIIKFAAGAHIDKAYLTPKGNEAKDGE